MALVIITGFVTVAQSLASLLLVAPPVSFVWLASATVMLGFAWVGSIFGLSLLWFAGGKEVAHIESGAVRHRRSIFGITVSRTALKDAYVVSPDPLVWQPSRPYPWHTCVGLSSGSVVVHVPGRTFRFGGALEQHFAESIASAMNNAVSRGRSP